MKRARRYSEINLRVKVRSEVRSVSAAKVMGVQQSFARPHVPGNGQSATSADAAKGNGKGRNNAYAPGNTQPIRQPGEVMSRENK